MPYAFANGAGTEADPYQVWTANDLDNVRNYSSSHFIQMADVDLTEYANWEEGHTLTEGGVYDGNSYSIYNLTIISTPSGLGNGLFSNITRSTVKNVNLKDININITIPVPQYGMFKSIGSVAGISNYSLIENCSAEGSIIVSNIDRGEGNIIGGLVGKIENTTIKKSFTNCEIQQSFSLPSPEYTHSVRVGGLVGYSSASYYHDISEAINPITDCYVLGSINCSNSKSYLCVGGLFGLSSRVIMENCYSIASIHCENITGEIYQGGLIGFSEESTITSSYYNTELSECNDEGKGIPKTTTEMKQQSTYIDWNFDNTWNIDSAINDGYPYLLVFSQAEPEEPIIDDVIPSYPPASYIKLQFQAGDSEKYDMGIFYADKTRFRVGDPGAKVNARNSVGKYLRDQTYDERNNYSPMRLDDLLKKILTGAGITDFYVAPNSTQIGMQFAPNKSILDGIEEILAYAPGWVIREEVTGRVVIGPKDDAEFTQPSRYTFQRDRDIFSREQIKDDQLIYGRVCVHTTDFVVKVYRAVASSLGWLPPAQKTYYQSVPDGTTSQEAAALATELADSMANSGEIETFVCPFRPHLIPGDEAEILDSADSAFLGVITQVQHDFGAGGFYTTITVDSGGRIGRPRFKDLVNAINSVTTISHKF